LRLRAVKPGIAVLEVSSRLFGQNIDKNFQEFKFLNAK
jgi:hypothetical protein